MGFCTVINCMDGRVQQPVIEYLKKRFEAKYVDSITEPGPIQILAEQNDIHRIQSIIKRLNISLKKHGSSDIAVVAHYDCGGNPVPKDVQMEQLKDSIRFIREHDETAAVIGLWVDENWKVHEVIKSDQAV